MTERKYGLKLPRKVIMVDYGDDVGDLYIKFKHAKHTEGEPTNGDQIIIQRKLKPDSITQRRHSTQPMQDAGYRSQNS